MDINLSVKQIRKLLPEVEHILIFYTSGLVYQSSFDSINTPKVGEKLAKILDDIQNLYDLIGFEIEGYPTLIFETDGMDMMIVKISEDTNMVLFFRAVIEEKGLELDSPRVKQHIKNLRKLLDIGCIELAEKDLHAKVEELGKQYMHLVRLKLKKQRELDTTLDTEQRLWDQEEGTVEPAELKKIDQERKKIQQNIKEIEQDIERKTEEIDDLKKEMGQPKECADDSV